MSKWIRIFAIIMLSGALMLGCSKDDDNSTAPITAPNAPAGLQVMSTGATSVQLQWTDNATDEDAHYVERSASSNQSFGQVARLAANVASFTDTGLTSGSRYYYRVRAGHGSAYSAYSNEVWADATPNSPPQAPTVIFPLHQATSIAVAPLLQWAAADPDNDTLTYDVYFGLTVDPPVASSGLSQPSLQRTALDTGTVYYWRVVVKDGYFETTGPVWNFRTAASASRITVVAPNGGERLVGDSTFEVEWTSEQLMGGVDIWISTDGGSNWLAEIGTNIPNTHSYQWSPQLPNHLGDACRLLVRSHTNPAVSDASDANFTVYLPWDAQVGGGNDVLWHADFADANQGWIVGEGGKILHTTDGGTTWTSYTHPSLRALYGVSFVDANNGWVVGDVGDILHTTNSGTEWNLQVSGTAAQLGSVDFVDATHGWAVGSGGTIRHTTNGGASWASQTSNSAAALSGLDFVDSNTGWIVGSNGTILHTTNGGTQWIPQTSGTAVWLNEVYFTDANHGWVVGETGKILYTANGGTNWVPQTSGISIGIHGVHMADNNFGWAVGNTGTILRTTNGGGTWSAQPSRTNRTLVDVNFADANNGWAVGFNGTIVHTNTGGQ